MTDCRSPEGIIVGLIDGMIAQARVVARYLREDRPPYLPDVQAALDDLRADEDVALVAEVATP